MKKANITIYQGATFGKPFYWYDGDEVITPITTLADGFPSGYPPVLGVTAHGLPALACPCRILGVKGPTAINTDPDDPNDRRYVTKIDANTASVAGVNISGLRPYLGNGFLVYTPPKDLTGYKARLQIRKTLTATDVLFEATTENGGIDLTDAEGLIEVSIAAVDTEAFTFKSGVYHLEMVLPGGVPADDVVTRIAYGTVKLDLEVTR